MDPNDPVVALCTEGMQAEAQGEMGRAKALFEQAWEAAVDDFGRCVAAHYVARHQDGAEATLHWNRECLRCADLVSDERVAAFYPSLHLNIGYCMEQLDELDAARHSYEAAEEALSTLADDAYGEMIRDGVARAFERLDG